MVMYQTTVTSGGLHIEGSTGGGMGRNAPAVFAGTPLPTVSPPAGALVGDLYLQHATTPTTQLIAMWELSGSGWAQLGAYADDAEVTAIANEYLVSVSTSAGTITITDQGGGITTYTSPFTSAEMTKLSGIETGATADQTASEIRDALMSLAGTNRLDASAVKGIHSQSVGNATTNDYGIVRLTNNTRVLDTSNATDAVTPHTLSHALSTAGGIQSSLPRASTTAEGIARFALTGSESTSGTSEALAMTPAGTQAHGDSRYRRSSVKVVETDLDTALTAKINRTINLPNLGDVTVTSPTHGQVLAYDTGTNQWENEDPVDAVSELTDVHLASLADNQILRYDLSRSDWTNVDLAESLEDLTDTTITAPANGQVLAYNDVDMDWRNITLPTPITTIGGLTDVTLSNPGHGQVLSYDTNANVWENTTPITTIGALTDVDTSGAATGQVLTYTAAGNWVSRDAAESVGDLTNVTLGALSDGQVLAYDDTHMDWRNITLATATAALSGLTDVNLGSLIDGQVLVYDLSRNEWQNMTLPSAAFALDGLTDVSVPSPTDGQALVYDNGTSNWVARTLPSVLNTLGGLTDTTIASPANGQFLGYNGTHWVNASLPAADETTVGVSRFATEVETREGTFDDGSVTPAKLLDVLTHTTGNHVRTTFLAGLDTRYRAAGAIALGDLDAGLQASINSILTQSVADGRYRRSTDAIALTDLTQTLQTEINSHLDQGEADLLYAPIGAPVTALSLSLPSPYGQLNITGTKQGGTTINGSVDLGSHYRLNTVQLVGADYGASSISETKLDSGVRTKLNRGDQAANHATTSSYGTTRLATENQSQDDTNAEDVITPHTMLYAGDRRFGPIGQDIVRQNTATLVNKHLTIPLVRQDGSTFDLTADLSAIAAPTGGTTGTLDVYYGGSTVAVGSFDASTILTLTHQMDTQAAARYSVTISAPSGLASDATWTMYLVLPEDESLDYVHLGPFDILPLFTEVDVTAGPDTYQVYHIDDLDAASTYDLQFEIAHFSGGILNRSRIAHGAIGPDQLADMAATESKHATGSVSARVLGSSKRPYAKFNLQYMGRNETPNFWWAGNFGTTSTTSSGYMVARPANLFVSTLDLSTTFVSLTFHNEDDNYELSQVLRNLTELTSATINDTSWNPDLVINGTNRQNCAFRLVPGLFDVHYRFAFGAPNSGVGLVTAPGAGGAASMVFGARAPAQREAEEDNEDDFTDGEIVGTRRITVSEDTLNTFVQGESTGPNMVFFQRCWSENLEAPLNWGTTRNRRYAGYVIFERIE